MPRSLKDVERELAGLKKRRAQIAEHMDEHLGLLGEAIVLHDQLTEAILDLAAERSALRVGAA
jgi:hypothetical protein